MTGQGTRPAFPSGLPEEAVGGGIPEQHGPGDPRSDDDRDRAHAEPEQCGGDSRPGTRIPGLFQMSRPKRNVAFATMATTIT